MMMMMMMTMAMMLPGTIIGLAIYNQVLLDVQLPIAVYKKLISQPLTLEDLKEVDPPVGSSMQALLDYPGDDVEVRCVTRFSVDSCQCTSAAS